MDVETERLREHVATLSRVPRPLESAELEEARRYCAGHLEVAGWELRQHPFTNGATGIELRGVNVVATHREHPLGKRPRFSVGAHIDSRSDTPGADDNASAVAALLEIARLLPAMWPANAALDLELVLYDLEECGMLGGEEHARLLKSQNVDLRGMVSLEMLGYCDHSAGSQSLPKLLKGIYPDVGNFIGIVGNQRSSKLIERFHVGMRTIPDLPIEVLAVPGNGELLQATRLSDHSPFWDAGYAALMITDTSFLRNPHYHLPSDTLETLDMDFLTKVTRGCVEAVRLIVEQGL